MNLIADGLLIATALTAAIYCVVLSRRLRNLTDAQSGVAAQIKSLNNVLEDTKGALVETRRGMSQARGAAQSAREGLMREVIEAKALLSELIAVRDDMRSSIVPPQSNTKKETDELASEPISVDQDDDIPDWPDGVVPAPDEVSGPENQASTLDDFRTIDDLVAPQQGSTALLGESEYLLKVQRMSL